MNNGKNKIYFYIIVGTLFISLLVNVYMGILGGNYKKRMYSKSYNAIHTISNVNIEENKIIEVAIKDNRIKKSELIKLKQGYDSILEKSLSLIDDDMFNSGDEKSVNSYMKNSKVILSDTYIKVKPYLTKLLEQNMCNTSEYIEIKGKDKIYFNSLYSLSRDINEYYENLVKTKSTDGAFDGIKIKIEKGKLWQDVLYDMNKIHIKYSDIEFSLEHLEKK